ncbi:hypothetical protein [Glycomyces paridis]|nr:hypothetical protein [Glycomyces paridis]
MDSTTARSYHASTAAWLASVIDRSAREARTSRCAVKSSDLMWWW